jgi:hypothetical protein
MQQRNIMNVHLLSYFVHDSQITQCSQKFTIAQKLVATEILYSWSSDSDVGVAPQRRLNDT